MISLLTRLQRSDIIFLHSEGYGSVDRRFGSVRVAREPYKLALEASFIRVWPSGKATVFGSVIPKFESWHPSHIMIYVVSVEDCFHHTLHIPQDRETNEKKV